ncbi:methenyltetrahydrofolate synthase domain-containing protein isoform X1 [Dendrobates tinctorius]|uniref:methenyltetrahydrofolate synthase domain-containing protein isoform X1 n=2 Tax=Dendrobates tinctorius TaxID=92724 RepID=UPI003CC997B2
MRNERDRRGASSSVIGQRYGGAASEVSIVPFFITRTNEKPRQKENAKSKPETSRNRGTTRTKKSEWAYGCHDATPPDEGTPIETRVGAVAPSLGSGCSKWDVRQKVWDYMEHSNLADFPRPVHHRIPNFKAAHRASRRLTALEVFSRAQEIKVDPDKPLEGVRLAALQANKTLLVPTPRLRTGLFNRITPPPGANKEALRICSTFQGVKDFSVPLGLDSAMQVDLVVVGSVAVSEKGWRIGKGEGFADMEFAMMVAMGAVTERTVVITVVHDCQVLDFPEDLLDDHDLTVDYILTPTRVITTGCTRPKPQGIIWSKISRDLMSKIPILRRLQEMERSAGKDVTLKSEAELPTRGSTRAAHPSPTVPTTEHPDQSRVSTVYMGNIPPTTRVSELKGILRERGASPVHLAWQGAQHRAFLDYMDPQTAQRALPILEGLRIGGQRVRVEMARAQWDRETGDQRKRSQDSRHGGAPAGK